MKDNENSIEKGYFDMYNYFEYSELVLYNVTKTMLVYVDFDNLTNSELVWEASEYTVIPKLS